MWGSKRGKKKEEGSAWSVGDRRARLCGLPKEYKLGGRAQVAMANGAS